MTYVKIGSEMFPASVSGKLKDFDWGERASKTIRLEMTHAEAVEMFVDDIAWSIVEEFENDQGETVQAEFDNSDYCKAGDIIDHRNGELSVKMGRLTDGELLAIITGGN